MLKRNIPAQENHPAQKTTYDLHTGHLEVDITSSVSIKNILVLNITLRGIKKPAAEQEPLNVIHWNSVSRNTGLVR